MRNYKNSVNDRREIYPCASPIMHAKRNNVTRKMVFHLRIAFQFGNTSRAEQKEREAKQLCHHKFMKSRNKFLFLSRIKLIN